MSRMWWKSQKTFAMLANRRQWQRDFDPVESQELEIVTEDNQTLMIETTDAATPTYYRTE